MPVPVGIRPVLSKYRVEVSEGAVPLPAPLVTFAQGLFLSLLLHRGPRAIKLLVP